jgi:hypothetical protein
MRRITQSDGAVRQRRPSRQLGELLPPARPLAAALRGLFGPPRWFLVGSRFFVGANRRVCEGAPHSVVCGRGSGVLIQTAHPLSVRLCPFDVACAPQVARSWGHRADSLGRFRAASRVMGVAIRTGAGREWADVAPLRSIQPPPPLSHRADHFEAVNCTNKARRCPPTADAPPF